jgi:hypothetical protein
MNDASRSFVPMEWLFIGLGVLGVVGTWAQAFGYLGNGFVAGNVTFWRETVATPASTFITVDLLVLGAALFVWMFAEGRRLGIGAVWLWGYFLVSTLIGISFAVPVFLAHRHRRMRRNGHGEIGAPAGADWIAIGFAILIAVAAVAYSLSRPY